MVQLGPVPPEEVDLPSRKLPGRQACSSIKESRQQALKELPDGFYVCEAGRSKSKRLHWLGYCWMVPGVDYFVYSFKGPLMPLEHEYEEVCNHCSAALAKPELQASGSDTDPSTDIDQHTMSVLSDRCSPLPPSLFLLRFPFALFSAFQLWSR